MDACALANGAMCRAPPAPSSGRRHGKGANFAIDSQCLTSGCVFDDEKKVTGRLDNSQSLLIPIIELARAK